MIGNLNLLPWSATMRQALGLSADIKDSLVYSLSHTIEDAEYPNKIGSQDRAAAGGEVFTGRALAFDGVDQYASVADNGALDVAATEVLPSGDDLNVSDCVNNTYTSFTNITPNGFDTTSDGTAVHTAATADEITIVNTRKYVVTFDMVLNSGTAPIYDLYSAVAGVSCTVEGDQLAVDGENVFVFTANLDRTGVLRFRNNSTTTNYSITNLSVKEATQDFVISGWAKAGIGTSSEILFGKTDVVGGAGRYIWFKSSDNRIGFVLQTTTVTIVEYTSIDTDLDTDDHLFTAHIDIIGSKLYIYTDGVLENIGGTTIAGTIPAFSDDFAIGAANDGAGWDQYAETQIRDVRIYHKDVTSAADLAALQAGERLGDEVAWWFCEGTDLLEVFDASGNDYHLTAANFDSTSFVEGNWQSLYNKLGYSINTDLGSGPITTPIPPDMSSWDGNKATLDLAGDPLVFCFHPETRILTDKGFIEAQNVQFGDKIYQDDGAFHELRNIIVSDKEDESLVSIKARGVPHVKLTQEHEVLRLPAENVRKYRMQKNANATQRNGRDLRPLEITTEWAQAKDIVKGDYLVIPKPKQYKSELQQISPVAYYSLHKRAWSKKFEMDFDEELAELFGWYIAEGSTAKSTGRISWVLSYKEKAEAERIKFLLREKLDLISSINRNGNSLVIACNNTVFRDFLIESFGRGARNKKVPQFIKDSPNNVILAFMRAWIDGDGCYTSSGSQSEYISLVTSSDNGVADAMILLKKLGIAPSVYRIKPKEKVWIIDRWSKSNGGWNINISGQGLLPFAPSKVASDERYFEDDDYFYVPITSIKREDYTGKVYDFTTDTGTICTPFVVHNCGQAQYNAIARDRGCFVGDGAANWGIDSAITIDKDDDSTIEFKIKITDLSVNNVIFGKLSAAGTNYIYITTSGAIFSETNTNSDSFLSEPGIITEDVWHEVAIRINNSVVSIVVDGVTVSMSDNVISDDLIFDRVGVRGSSDIINGQLQYLSINGIANWQFVEGQGSTVYDVSVDENGVANGNHLTGVNVDQNNWGVIDTPDEDYLAEKGATIVEYLGDTVLVPFLSTKQSQYLSVAPILNVAETYTDYSQAGNNLIPETYMSMLEVKELIDADAEIKYRGDMMDENKGTFNVQLGDSLMDVGKGDFNDGTTESWLDFGTNTIENEDNALKVIYVDNQAGAYVFFREAADINIDLTIGGRYRITALAKKSGGGQGIRIYDGVAFSPEVELSDQYSTITIDFTAQSTTGAYIGCQGMAAGDIIWIDEWYIQEILNDSDTESWVAYGTNIIENEDDALKITYVDNSLGAYHVFRETNDINTNLILGDTYKVIVRAKINSGSSVSIVMSTGEVIGIAVTEDYQYYEGEFVCTDVDDNNLRFSMSAGEIIWIDTWEIFKKTEQVGNNLIANGGARNEIGALITTDWVDPIAGLAAGFTSSGVTPTIVTGNGFSGNAQRLDVDVSATDANIRKVLTNVIGATYRFTVTYRSSNSLSVLNGMSLDSSIAANTGDAITVTKIATSTADNSNIRFGITAGASLDTDWFEIDEWEIRPIIDGEFFEPVALGSDPVIVGINYLLANPWRYLTRYVNAFNRKDLILLEADHTLDYDDHLDILKFTKNTE